MVCTCGQCINGILSPRMLYRLEKTATASADMVLDSMPEFRGDQPMHDPEVYLLDYVPPELRMEVARPFVVGFANAMSAAAYLSRQRQLPKPRMVSQMMGIVPGLDKEASKFFAAKGGAPEYALDAVLARVEEEHEGGGGDGSFAQDEAHAKALAGMPACKNDDQFQLLRQQLFANSDFWPCGPYGFDDEGEGQECGQEWAGDDGGDGWVHYDTSNWVPPAAKAAAAAAAAGAAGSAANGAAANGAAAAGGSS